MEIDSQARAEPVKAGGTVEVSVRCDAPAWGEFFGAHDGAGVYHDPRWGQVMAEAYGNRPFYLTARRGERVVGAVQLIRQKSMLFGSHLCSTPYFDAAGIVADDEAARAALTEAAGRLAADEKVQWAELRQLEPLADDLPARTDKVTMWLPLPSGSEAMWKQLKTKVRTKVRRSQKNDLAVEAGGGELLGDFHGVYSRTMRDLGSPPHSKRFFRLIVEAFGDQVRLFSVRSEGRALAASLTLTDRHGFHVPWSGSDARFRKLGANRLLYWTMLAHAADAQCPRFDFGRSSKESGTYEFKKEWGAEPVPLWWHYLLPEGAEPPSLRPDSPKFRLMVACWRKLPLWAARAMGPRLIAKLP